MKHAIVSGANTGIGYATAKGLLQQGIHVSMFCRNADKANTAKKQLINETNNSHIDVFIVDFSSLNSIENACKSFKAIYQNLDILVNNAGATFAQFKETEDGIEQTIAVNHLGYFAMTYHLFPLLKKSKDARIINVASDSHYGSKLAIDKLNDKASYFIYKQYEHSKLCNVLFTKYLAKHINTENMSTMALHPGVVKTKIGNKADSKIFGFFWSVFSFFGVSTYKGAETSIYLATTDKPAEKNGKYFANKREKKSAGRSYKENLQKELWDWSEKKCNINWHF